MNKKLTYSKAMEELNKILEDLESEKVDVDEIINKVKTAISIIKFCREKIENTELELKEVVKELDKEIKD
jgi:exodeoxyribonuclease VII small subunit